MYGSIDTDAPSMAAHDCDSGPSRPTANGYRRTRLGAAVVIFGVVAVATRRSIGGPGQTESAADMHAHGNAYGTGSRGGDAEHSPAAAQAAPEHNSFATALKRTLQVASSEDFVLFGHEEDNLSGQHFNNYDPFMSGLSDTLNATGAYPAVVGYDFSETVYDGIDLAEHVKEAYMHGSIVTFDFRANNPATNGAYNNISGQPCREICTEGTTAHERFYEDLASVADAISNYTYTTSAGTTELIPLVLRFFHESQGGWYWWGNATTNVTLHDGSWSMEPTCSTEDYQLVWERTTTFFSDKGFDNILWLYAPASPVTYGKAKVLERLPKLASVDMIGIDQYTLMGEYKSYMAANCDIVASIAEEYGLIPTIAETGITDGMEDVNASMWYDDTFADTLKSGNCSKMAYALTWANYNTDSYWVPIEGEAGIRGVVKMHDDKHVLFADSVRWRDLAKSAGYIDHSG